MRPLWVSLTIAIVSTVLACAQPVPPRTKPSDARPEARAYRVAVATAAPAPHAEGGVHVGHYLAEALLERGVDVVTAHDSAGTLANLSRSSDFHLDASRLTRVAVARLGVDALLLVELTRWSPRDPKRAGSAAAVGFRATLHGRAEGHLLWSGGFSERQTSFFDSPWRAVRYPGRGTRWLSVEELARWGCRRLAAEIPIDSAPR